MAFLDLATLLEVRSLSSSWACIAVASAEAELRLEATHLEGWERCMIEWWVMMLYILSEPSMKYGRPEPHASLSHALVLYWGRIKFCGKNNVIHYFRKQQDMLCFWQKKTKHFYDTKLIFLSFATLFCSNHFSIRCQTKVLCFSDIYNMNFQFWAVLKIHFINVFSILGCFENSCYKCVSRDLCLLLCGL